MIKKICNFKFVIRNCQAGMTYVEIIVVLSIFATMSSIVLFNYNAFQDKVNIKVLANEIALKIVEAQKSSLAGQLPTLPPLVFPWKPSYGVYFDDIYSGNNKSFVYFVDLDQDSDYIDPFFCPTPGALECLDKINITNNNYMSEIKSYTGDVLVQTINDPLTILFKRPDSSAIFTANGLDPNFEYIQITISSPTNITSKIKVYKSGRIQIN